METGFLCVVSFRFYFFNVFLHCYFSYVDVHSTLDCCKAIYIPEHKMTLSSLVAAILQIKCSNSILFHPLSLAFLLFWITEESGRFCDSVLLVLLCIFFPHWQINLDCNLLLDQDRLQPTVSFKEMFVNVTDTSSL